MDLIFNGHSAAVLSQEKMRDNPIALPASHIIILDSYSRVLSLRGTKLSTKLAVINFVTWQSRLLMCLALPNYFFIYPKSRRSEAKTDGCSRFAQHDNPSLKLRVASTVLQKQKTGHADKQ